MLWEEPRALYLPRLPQPRPVTLENVTGSKSFPTVSPDSLMSVTCAQREPAVICEESEPVANLPVPHGPLATPIASIFDGLARNTHRSGLP